MSQIYKWVSSHVMQINMELVHLVKIKDVIIIFIVLNQIKIKMLRFNLLIITSKQFPPSIVLCVCHFCMVVIRIISNIHIEQKNSIYTKFIFKLNLKNKKVINQIPTHLNGMTSGGARNLGRGARLKNKIGNKKLININNKISKQLYDNVIVIQNLT